MSKGGRRVLVLGVLAGIALAAPPTAAQAAPSIESIKYVTVFNPPGGGTPIRRETNGPSGGTGLTAINVDNDATNELTANVGLSFDAAELAVTGQLQISRTDFGGLLGPTTLPTLPVWVEASAVLKDTVNGVTTRQNVAVGYDTRASSAPGRFTLDIGSCTTPNCKSTPTTCTAPCKGTKTTLSMGVVAPSSSMRLTGELSKFATGGGREDPTRAEIDFSPVPGASSPVVFTIWGTETKASTADDAPVATLTHVSMNGNKEALKATAHICRLPKETYQPKQIGDTACDAAGYESDRLDSRILDATLDRLPRDVATGNARVGVTVADNGLGRKGGLTTLTYDSSHPVQKIDVNDRVVTWTGTSKREGERIYHLVDVPTSATLSILDESDVAGTSDPITKHQTATYDAGGQLTSADVTNVEHRDGELTKRETLFIQTVPTHLKVIAEEAHEEEILFGLIEPGFDKRTRQSVALAEASSAIGVIEYSSAAGETTAAPPADIGNAYVYTNKPEGGTQFTKLRLLGAEHGDFTIARHEHLDPKHFDLPFVDDPEVEGGLELLSVTGKIAPTPFRTLAEDGNRVFDVRVNDLPNELDLELRPEEGKIDYDGSAPIGTITVHAADPAGLFERANTLDVLLEGVPRDVGVQYPSEGREDIDLKVENGEIGKLELTALHSGDAVPADVLGAEDDGVIIRDLEGIEDVPDEYVIFARVRGLRHVAVTEFDHDVDDDPEHEQLTTTKQFTLDSTAGRTFVFDGHTTAEIKEVTSHNGSGWGDSDRDCEMETVGYRRDKMRAVIESLQPSTTLSYDKRHSFGQRDCYEHVVFGPAPGFMLGKNESKDISYSAAAPAGRMDFLMEDANTNLYVKLDPLPTSLRFCRADGHQCLPEIGDGYGISEGSLQFKASDYVTVNMVDCEEEFEDGSCGSANTRVTDLQLKRVDFWGDQDSEGISGDLYLNTADWDTGENQPFHGGRIKSDSIDFKFGDGFYARGAHIYWDNIWDDEQSDWSPDGTGGTVFCPSGTDWQVHAVGSWWGTTEDWCNSGEAND